MSKLNHDVFFSQCLLWKKKLWLEKIYENSLLSINVFSMVFIYIYSFGIFIYKVPLLKFLVQFGTFYCRWMGTESDAVTSAQISFSQNIRTKIYQLIKMTINFDYCPRFLQDGLHLIPRLWYNKVNSMLLLEALRILDTFILTQNFFWQYPLKLEP